MLVRREIQLRDAVTRSVRLAGCDIPEIDARFARIEGQLNLAHANLHGPLNLVHAHIVGELDLIGLFMDGARLEVDEGDALCLENATTTNLVLSNGFIAKGTVRLRYRPR